MSYGGYGGQGFSQASYGQQQFGYGQQQQQQQFGYGRAAAPAAQGYQRTINIGQSLGSAPWKATTYPGTGAYAQQQQMQQQMQGYGGGYGSKPAGLRPQNFGPRPGQTPKAKKVPNPLNPPQPSVPQGAAVAVGLVKPYQVPTKTTPPAVAAAQAKAAAEKAKQEAKKAELAAKQKEAGEKRKATAAVEGESAPKQQRTRTSQVVPDDFKLNEKKIYTGVVKEYWKLNGYGFITLDEKNFAPDDKVFVFWSSINSIDRFPFLHKDQKVQFNIKKEKDKKGQTTLKADAVSQVGGAPVSVAEEDDAKKIFVVSQASRFYGKLKFFNPKKGFGYIAVNEGQNFGGEDVPKELRVEIAEVNAGGGQPGYLSEVDVEFGVWKNRKGAFKAYNMSGPNQTPLPTIEVAPMPEKEDKDATKK